MVELLPHMVLGEIIRQDKANETSMNLEAGRTGDASRTMYIDDNAETNLYSTIEHYQSLGDAGWQLEPRVQNLPVKHGSAPPVRISMLIGVHLIIPQH